MKKKIKIYPLVAQILCLVALFIFMFPVVLMLEKSFEVEGFRNYRMVFDYYNLLPNFCTSLIVVGGTLLIVGIVVSMAAFAFSKLWFPFQKTIYYILLSGMMIPASALIFPIYQIVRKLGINNTGFSLIFPYAVLACCFNLMVLKNYYDALPNELMDAAKIDGANKWKMFASIMVPIAKPGLIFVLMQTFLSSWNELQMAMIFINDTDVQPLSVIPLRFMQQGSSGSAFTLQVVYAACVICLLPIVLFFLFGARMMVDGLTTGAVKG